MSENRTGKIKSPEQLTEDLITRAKEEKRKEKFRKGDQQAFENQTNKRLMQLNQALKVLSDRIDFIASIVIPRKDQKSSKEKEEEKKEGDENDN